MRIKQHILIIAVFLCSKVAVGQLDEYDCGMIITERLDSMLSQNHAEKYLPVRENVFMAFLIEFESDNSVADCEMVRADHMPEELHAAVLEFINSIHLPCAHESLAVNGETERIKVAYPFVPKRLDKQLPIQKTHQDELLPGDR